MKCFTSVIQKEPSQCSESAHVQLTSTQGYLASVLSQETPCGTRSAPWRITTESVADTIKLTLHDFSTLTPPGGAARAVSSCIVYATVWETGERHDICGNNVVTRQVYTSSSNDINIIINTPTAYYFLLEYNGT